MAATFLFFSFFFWAHACIIHASELCDRFGWCGIRGNGNNEVKKYIFKNVLTYMQQFHQAWEETCRGGWGGGGRGKKRERRNIRQNRSRFQTECTSWKMCSLLTHYTAHTCRERRFFCCIESSKKLITEPRVWWKKEKKPSDCPWRSNPPPTHVSASGIQTHVSGCTVKHVEPSAVYRQGFFFWGGGGFN